MVEKKLFDGLHPPLCSTAMHVTLMSAFLSQTTASSQTQTRSWLVVRTVAFTSQLQKYSLIIATNFAELEFFLIPSASIRFNNVLVLFTAASSFEGWCECRASSYLRTLTLRLCDAWWAHDTNRLSHSVPFLPTCFLLWFAFLCSL